MKIDQTDESSFSILDLVTDILSCAIQRKNIILILLIIF